MICFQKNNSKLCMDFKKAEITSLVLNGEEVLADEVPIFCIAVRDKNGDRRITHAYAAENIKISGNTAVYSGLPYDLDVKLTVSENGLAEFGIEVINNGDTTIEWVEYPCLSLKPLEKNGGHGSILFPYNEGALVTDIVQRQSEFRHFDSDYPSRGAFAMFPNMLCSQFICYMWKGHGLYLGDHDKRRGVKQIDFYQTEKGISLQNRVFCGCENGQGYVQDFSVVLDAFEGDWHDGAKIYRDWFEKNLPDGVTKTESDPTLPSWYGNSPLIVSYPVRGVHDMDKMTPNALFPYTNALTLIDEIAKKTEMQIMVLLMHWEGSAPWAPPYVWPPFGGEENFNEFLHELHKNGNLLGVYCSGFGYTLQSNLIQSYNMEKEYTDEKLSEAMCTSAKGEIISCICQAQRKSYDLCVRSEKARKLLDKAYRPLLQSEVDYIQILDQNHGGGQYFCYSPNHGHPPVPGTWMTDSMKELLSEWNETAGKTLLGCESAASEAFIKYLKFSDNRYELNWHMGIPVPLYAYLYHPYLRNFMGNQVSCGLTNIGQDTMCYRMAYSFLCGDCMTLVIQQNGQLMANWGCHDFENIPDVERALKFAKNMGVLYGKAKEHLCYARMEKPESYICDEMEFTRVNGTVFTDRCILSTAWEHNGAKVQIFVNHTDRPHKLTFKNKEYTVAPLDGIIVEI